MTVRRDGANREIAAGGRALLLMGKGIAAGLRYRIAHAERTSFDDYNTRALEQAPAFEAELPWHFGPITGSCSGSGGIVLFGLNDSLDLAPDASASVEARAGGQTARLYVRHSGLPWYIPYDSSDETPYPLLDRCRIGGGEFALRSHGIGLVLGCQSVEGVQSGTVRRTWPEGVPPYEQPHLSFLAAPHLGPWHGLTLNTRLLLTDTRPIFKARSALTFSIHPINTREFIDIKLLADYWSERDTITFAGSSDWGNPVYNCGSEIAFHISDFRFFGKIDNLLNRKFAYVPGYYSPGITFRWGFNWYLQK
jgi:hypothetical protein